MTDDLEITLRIPLQEDDGSSAETIAGIIADSLSNDVVQDEIFAGSGCEVMFGQVIIVSVRKVHHD